MTVKRYTGQSFEFTVPVLVAGAGACGLTAALAAKDAGADVLVLERDAVPLGTTAMSSGLIPAAGTKAQREAGVLDDSSERFAVDLIEKTKDALEPYRAAHITAQSTYTVDWLIEKHAIPLTLFKAGGALPGHSRPRLHGTPNRTGEELIASLQSAAEDAGADIMTNSRVSAIIADDERRVHGVEVTRPDGSIETIGCDTLILATCGFASNQDLVSELIPEIAGAVIHTHTSSQGEAILWGQKLGAKLGDIHSYQGHANVAAGHGLLVSWLAVSEGGIQVNGKGKRFSNEARGYSEQAVDVVKQPGHFAWTIYDERIHTIMLEIAEYRDVVSTGTLKRAQRAADLAQAIKVPKSALVKALTDIDICTHSASADKFGRIFKAAQKLSHPLIAVKVNGALFHTQGGLEVDETARVLDTKNRAFPNLFAGGGAARGVSGPDASGYVAGNGLMTATTLGRLAGQAAAAQVAATQSQKVSA